jgi:hypothetical protein
MLKDVSGFLKRNLMSIKPKRGNKKLKIRENLKIKYFVR